MTGEFKRAYPNAKLIGVEDAIKNMSDKDLQFDGCMSLPFLFSLVIEVKFQCGVVTFPVETMVLRTR